MSKPVQTPAAPATPIPTSPATASPAASMFSPTPSQFSSTVVGFKAARFDVAAVTSFLEFGFDTIVSFTAEIDVNCTISIVENNQ